MKKRLLSVVALAALILTGCGETSSTTEGNSSFVWVDGEDQEASIVWWNNYKQPGDADAGKDEATLRKSYAEYYYAKDAIEAFHAAHPKITVEQKYQGSYTDIAKKVSSGLGTGDVPNIVSTYQDNVYAWKDSILDMTTYATKLEADEDFNHSYLSIEKGIYSGRYLSLPYSKSSEMLVVNDSAFDLEGAGNAGTSAGSYVAPVAGATKKKYSVPTTWDEMISTARTIKTDFSAMFEDNKDDDGYFTALPICWDSGENMAISFLENAGIAYTDASASKAADKVPVFDNAKAKELFVQLKKWNAEGLIGTQNQLKMSGKYHIYGSEMFYDGCSFMNISSTAGASYFAADGFKASIHAAPSYNNSSKVISQGPSLAFFDKGTAANDAAFKFYEFLTAPEQGAVLSTIDSYFPLRSSTYNQDAVKTLTDAGKATVTAESAYADKKNNYVGQAMALNNEYSSKENYFISDVFEYSAKARTAIGNMVTSLFNADVTTDAEITAKVDELFAAAKTEVFTA